jgi:hypothetical protein
MDAGGQYVMICGGLMMLLWSVISSISPEVRIRREGVGVGGEKGGEGEEGGWMWEREGEVGMERGGEMGRD